MSSNKYITLTILAGNDLVPTPAKEVVLRAGSIIGVTNAIPGQFATAGRRSAVYLESGSYVEVCETQAEVLAIIDQAAPPSMVEAALRFDLEESRRQLEAIKVESDKIATFMERAGNNIADVIAEAFCWMTEDNPLPEVPKLKCVPCSVCSEFHDLTVCQACYDTTINDLRESSDRSTALATALERIRDSVNERVFTSPRPGLRSTAEKPRVTKKVPADVAARMKLGPMLNDDEE